MAANIDLRGLVDIAHRPSDDLTMTLKKLRQHLEMRPFQPLIVRTVSGARHAVNHPDYLLIPPVGDTFLIVDPDGTFHHLGVSHVEAVEIRAKAGRSK